MSWKQRVETWLYGKWMSSRRQLRPADDRSGSALLANETATGSSSCDNSDADDNERQIFDHGGGDVPAIMSPPAPVRPVLVVIHAVTTRIASAGSRNLVATPSPRPSSLCATQPSAATNGSAANQRHRTTEARFHAHRHRRYGNSSAAPAEWMDLASTVAAAVSVVLMLLYRPETMIDAHGDSSSSSRPAALAALPVVVGFDVATTLILVAEWALRTWVLGPGSTDDVGPQTQIALTDPVRKSHKERPRRHPDALWLPVDGGCVFAIALGVILVHCPLPSAPRRALGALLLPAPRIVHFAFQVFRWPYLRCRASVVATAALKLFATLLVFSLVAFLMSVSTVGLLSDRLHNRCSIITDGSVDATPGARAINGLGTSHCTPLISDGTRAGLAVAVPSATAVFDAMGFSPTFCPWGYACSPAVVINGTNFGVTIGETNASFAPSNASTADCLLSVRSSDGDTATHNEATSSTDDTFDNSWTATIVMLSAMAGPSTLLQWTTSTQYGRLARGLWARTVAASGGPWPVWLAWAGFIVGSLVLANAATSVVRSSLRQIMQPNVLFHASTVRRMAQRRRQRVWMEVVQRDGDRHDASQNHDANNADIAVALWEDLSCLERIVEAVTSRLRRCRRMEAVRNAASDAEATSWLNADYRAQWDVEYGASWWPARLPRASSNGKAQADVEMGTVDGNDARKVFADEDAPTVSVRDSLAATLVGDAPTPWLDEPIHVELVRNTLLNLVRRWWFQHVVRTLLYSLVSTLLSVASLALLCVDDVDRMTLKPSGASVNFEFVVVSIIVAGTSLDILSRLFVAGWWRFLSSPYGFALAFSHSCFVATAVTNAQTRSVPRIVVLTLGRAARAVVLLPVLEHFSCMRLPLYWIGHMFLNSVLPYAVLLVVTCVFAAGGMFLYGGDGRAIVNCFADSASDKDASSALFSFDTVSNAMLFALRLTTRDRWTDARDCAWATLGVAHGFVITFASALVGALCITHGWFRGVAMYVAGKNADQRNEREAVESITLSATSFCLRNDHSRGAAMSGAASRLSAFGAADASQTSHRGALTSSMLSASYERGAPSPYRVAKRTSTVAAPPRQHQGVDIAVISCDCFGWPTGVAERSLVVLDAAVAAWLLVNWAIYDPRIAPDGARMQTLLWVDVAAMAASALLSAATIALYRAQHRRRAILLAELTDAKQRPRGANCSYNFAESWIRVGSNVAVIACSVVFWSLRLAATPVPRGAVVAFEVLVAVSRTMRAAVEQHSVRVAGRWMGRACVHAVPVTVLMFAACGLYGALGVRLYGSTAPCFATPLRAAATLFGIACSSVSWGQTAAAVSVSLPHGAVPLTTSGDRSTPYASTSNPSVDLSASLYVVVFVLVVSTVSIHVFSVLAYATSDQDELGARGPRLAWLLILRGVVYSVPLPDVADLDGYYRRAAASQLLFGRQANDSSAGVDDCGKIRVGIRMLVQRLALRLTQLRAMLRRVLSSAAYKYGYFVVVILNLLVNATAGSSSNATPMWRLIIQQYNVACNVGFVLDVVVSMASFGLPSYLRRSKWHVVNVVLAMGIVCVDGLIGAAMDGRALSGASTIGCRGLQLVRAIRYIPPSRKIGTRLLLIGQIVAPGLVVLLSSSFLLCFGMAMCYRSMAWMQGFAAASPRQMAWTAYSLGSLSSAFSHVISASVEYPVMGFAAGEGGAFTALATVRGSVQEWILLLTSAIVLLFLPSFFTAVVVMAVDAADDAINIARPLVHASHQPIHRNGHSASTIEHMILSFYQCGGDVHSLCIEVDALSVLLRRWLRFGQPLVTQAAQVCRLADGRASTIRLVRAVTALSAAAASCCGSSRHRAVVGAVPNLRTTTHLPSTTVADDDSGQRASPRCTDAASLFDIWAAVVYLAVAASMRDVAALIDAPLRPLSSFDRAHFSSWLSMVERYELASLRATFSLRVHSTRPLTSVVRPGLATPPPKSQLATILPAVSMLDRLAASTLLRAWRRHRSAFLVQKEAMRKQRQIAASLDGAGDGRPHGSSVAEGVRTGPTPRGNTDPTDSVGKADIVVGSLTARDRPVATANNRFDEFEVTELPTRKSAFGGRERWVVGRKASGLDAAGPRTHDARTLRTATSVDGGNRHATASMVEPPDFEDLDASTTQMGDGDDQHGFNWGRMKPITANNTANTLVTNSSDGDDDVVGDWQRDRHGPTDGSGNDRTTTATWPRDTTTDRVASPAPPLTSVDPFSAAPVRRSLRYNPLDL